MVYIERVLDSEWSAQAKHFTAAPYLKRLCNFLIDFFIGGTATALILGTFCGLLMALTDIAHLLDYYKQSLICRWAMTAVVLITYYTSCEFIFQTVTFDGGEFRSLAGEFNGVRQVPEEMWDAMEKMIRDTNKKQKSKM